MIALKGRHISKCPRKKYSTCITALKNWRFPTQLIIITALKNWRFPTQLIIFLDFWAEILRIAWGLFAHPVNFSYLPPWSVCCFFSSFESRFLSFETSFRVSSQDFWISSQNFLSFEPSFWVSSQVFEFRAKFSSVSLIFKFWGRIPSQVNLFRVKILKFRVVFTFSSQNFKIPRQNFKESSFHFFESKL